MISSASSIGGTWRRGRRRRHHQNAIVTAAAAAAAGRLAVGGYTVIYDGVIGPWFLDAFSRATGLPRLHYAILLPPERVCLDRVASRVGHDFTDLAAAAQMYAECARADIDNPHVVTSPDTADDLGAHLYELVRNQSIVRPLERQPGSRSAPQGAGSFIATVGFGPGTGPPAA